MFRSRSKEGQAAKPQQAAAEPRQPRDPQAPKGRPTPKRSEAQPQRRTLATAPTNRKDAARRQREARRADMARQREALASGDERYLPARDKGPVRKLARDFVDARYSVAEFFLPGAVIILVLGMLSSPLLKQLSMLLWLALMLLIVIDSVGISIRLKKRLRERYPDEPKRGAVAYALMRTLQFRRMRLPKPQVARGEKP
ncbi:MULTISPECIES: DUF3043 domain-containing protein [Streptomyces]|uniref:Membrane protein n=1 Tax=Streptomyces cacaoi TaxID=1898 RepID=A0A4Y3R8R3_STRCI|nr:MULTISPECIES: DUF3043 domain-containing protein [Streptomyces]NNG88370.1 DUF3043 domain-containing protein [Streptomyces cacaoi]QHF93868.1 DUF3043 domain-containing protein [Streptomyces sp. NHF165]GEB53944.1 membrane protein [Streptomyces cacaoi]